MIDCFIQCKLFKKELKTVDLGSLKAFIELLNQAPYQLLEIMDVEDVSLTNDDELSFTVLLLLSYNEKEELAQINLSGPVDSTHQLLESLSSEFLEITELLDEQLEDFSGE